MCSHKQERRKFHVEKHCNMCLSPDINNIVESEGWRFMIQNSVRSFGYETSYKGALRNLGVYDDNNRLLMEVKAWIELKLFITGSRNGSSWCFHNNRIACATINLEIFKIIFAGLQPCLIFLDESSAMIGYDCLSTAEDILCLIHYCTIIMRNKSVEIC